MKKIKITLTLAIVLMCILSCTKKRFLRGEFKHVESYTIDENGKKQPYSVPGFLSCAFGDSLVKFDKNIVTYYFWNYSWTFQYEYESNYIEVFYENGPNKIEIEVLDKDILKVRNPMTSTYSIYEKK